MYESYILIFSLIGLMLIIYFKISVIYAIKFPLIVIIYIFSLILVPYSFDYELIGTPFIQIFFILLQTTILYFSSLEYYTIKNSKKDK